MASSRKIGSLNEKSLHVALKTWYLQPGDRTEVSVDRFIIDIVRDDLLVEIQTQNFSAIKSKLIELTTHYPIRLVHPIAQEKWIVKPVRNRNKKESRIYQDISP